MAMRKLLGLIRRIAHLPHFVTNSRRPREELTYGLTKRAILLNEMARPLAASEGDPAYKQRWMTICLNVGQYTEHDFSCQAAFAGNFPLQAMPRSNHGRSRRGPSQMRCDHQALRRKRCSVK